MELLFNKKGKGNEEIRDILGFIDVDINFNKLQTKIKTATNDVVALIGLEMYALALTEYKKDENANEDLIFAVRNPIALQGYRKFAPHNDLSHTTKGRINRIEQNEKAAFEWMIDKDDKALERSYYEALDDLIKYLDANVTAWKETTAFENTHKTFFRTADEFDEFFPINNSRLLLMKLSPGIKKCEKREIKSRIGAELFNTLKEQLKTNSENVNEELLYKIQEACASRALAWAMRRLSVQLFPEGVLQAFVSDRMTINARMPAIKSESEAAAQYFDYDADLALLEIESIIRKLKTVDIEIAPMEYKPNPNNKFLST